MSWRNVLIRFLQLNFLQVVISHCMVYRIPPQNFQLPCEPTGKNSGFLLPVGTAENGLSSNADHEPTKANATSLITEDHFLCCDWTDTYVNCFVYTAEMETKAFPQQTEDSVWNLQFWTAVNSKELFCVVGLSSKSSYLTEDFTVNLFYTLTDVSLEGNSTNSLKNNFSVIRCIAVKHPKYECQIPSMKLNHTYVMWLKITHGMALLQSPLISVVPLDIDFGNPSLNTLLLGGLLILIVLTYMLLIRCLFFWTIFDRCCKIFFEKVKPEPPLHMKIEMSDKGQLKISWSNSASKLYPLQYEVKYSANAAKNDYQAVEITMENSLILSNTLLDSSYVVQIRCKSLYGLGLWSDWSSPFHLNLQDVMYFPPKILASVGTNVSFYCIYKNKNKIISSKKIVWWLNLSKEIPRNQYTLVNDFVGKVTLVNLDAMKPGGNFLFNALYCCNENKECNHRYAELYIIDVNINITCETYGNLQKMTCRWSTNTDLLLSESTLLLRYYRSDVYCSESSSMPSDSEVKECHSQRNNSYECIFQPFYLLSGYTMWIEIRHPLGTLTSQPACILPKEVVKPFPPFNVKAEITREVGMLNVSWNNPELPKSDLQFQIRYAVNGTEITWEMHEDSTISGSCACIEVQDPCAVYVVQVRCSVLGGVGYWSDWSRPAFTVVKDIKTPLRGPKFWRIVNEDPVRKQKNVTLFWKPLEKNIAMCNVLDYVIEHTTSENITWSNYVENDTTYSFPWTEDVHTIKVIAVNSIGTSSVNFIITLSQQMNAVSIVKSLSAYPINSSCVIVSWMLSPAIYIVTSFVIEWTNLNEEEQIKWIMVPSHIRKCHIYDDFILIEKYRFSVYPIIPEGVGKPTMTEGFSKGGIEKQNYMNFYVILPLVILCLVLLLGAVLMLHQRMKTLFWADVPNPKNCSWAQSVNFQKPETYEHLFLKHPEALSFGPLLLEPEIVLEDICIHKAMKNEDKQDLLAVDSLCATIQDFEHDSACSSGHFNSGSVLDVETSDGAAGPSNVKYAAIITNCSSSGLYELPKDLDSSFETCFLGHDSLIPGSFSNSSWAMENPAFLVFPDGHPDPLKKLTSVSAVSSEGFSEPSDLDRSFTEEHSLQRSTFYLGMNSIKRSENDILLTENSNMICHFHTSALFHGMRFPRNTCCDLNPFISKCETSVQTFIPYMPQFQTLTIKLHETASSKT